jgi:hypothetical protein
MKLAPIARAALVLTLLAPMAGLPACAPVSPPFNPAVQSNTASLKTDTLALLDKAGDRYAEHAVQVDALTARIDAAASVAAATPQNTLAARQWNVLRDPNRALYGGTIKLWQAQDTLGLSFREEKKIQIRRAFDYILCLEANKQQAQSCGDVQGGGA